MKNKYLGKQKQYNIKGRYIVTIMSKNVNAIILAGGSGTRMGTTTCKFLEYIRRRPILFHVIDTVLSIGIKSIVIVLGKDFEHVMNIINATYVGNNFVFILQEK